MALALNNLSKHARICLACKMTSGREKRAIGGDRTHILPIVNRVWCQRACKLPHCAIDPDVAFWHESFLNPPGWIAFESWRRTRDELGCRTAGEDCWGKKRNIYQEIHTAAEAHRHTRLYMKDYIKSGLKNIDIYETLRRNWFHMFFLLLRKHTIHPLFFSLCVLYTKNNAI